MKSLIHSKNLLATFGTLALFATAGCNRDSVKVYKVENNETAISPAPAPAAGTMPSTMPNGLPTPDKSTLPTLKYTLPAGWKEKTLTQMRVASFDASEGDKQVDVSVIPLGGSAGGDASNVNRWRGQVGLPQLDETELQKLAEKVEVDGQPADLYDVSGTAPGSGDAERIIGVILHREDTSWFFKMTGDAELVEKNKTGFVAFLKSVTFGGLAAPSTMDLSQLPPSHPAIPGMSPSGVATPATDANDKPTWTIPTGWQEGPLTQFLIAKYITVAANGAKAEVNVSALAGDGGGLLANVNRWRQLQLGLEAVDQAGLSKIVSNLEANGSQTSLVDFTGTDFKSGKPARLIGVVVPGVNQTWFYKLMGDPDVVAAQKDAFLKFVQSAKYPDAH